MGSIKEETTPSSYQPFHIAATGHSLNYLPEYIAHRHGFFHAQGLEISVSVPQPWDKVLHELADGSADVALGGVWVPSMYHSRSRNYTAFAQVANRAPLAIVQRAHPGKKFELKDTVGSTVLMKGSNGASVGLYFKMLLREVGIDPKSVNYIQDLDSAMLSELFVGGMGDYLIVDNLSARTLVARYPEHVAIAHETVVRSGDVPWSVYYRETRGIDEDVLDKQRRFCIALAQGMQWVLDHDAEEFRDELADIFPKSPIETVVQLTNVFRKNRMWTSPVVDRQGYERWQMGIADGYLVEKPLAYETIVDNRPALRACPGK